MRNWDYIRLFDSERQPNPEEVDYLVEVMMQEPDRGRSSLPAGYTYFGQFIDHDLTLLRQNSIPPGRGPLPVEELSQGRKPALDLDSIYGGGLEDSVVPYDKANGKFLLGKARDGQEMDLPRDFRKVAQIADPRNDENLLIAQFQVMFMKFHNEIIDDLIKIQKIEDPEKLYTLAKEEVIRIYQYLVINDFAQKILPREIKDLVLRDGIGRIIKKKLKKRKKGIVMPVEFAGAALRFGHTMVRSSYRLRDETLGVELKQLFNLTGRGKDKELLQLPLPPGHIVDWRFFFRFEQYADHMKDFNTARPISTNVIPEMKNLKRDSERSGINIIRRNIERGVELDIASGQTIIEYLYGLFEYEAKHIKLSKLKNNDFLDKLKYTSMKDNTPLWVYILLESIFISDGSILGLLGGWIIADTLLSAAEFSDINIFNEHWLKKSILYNFILKLRNKPHVKLTIEDLLFYTYYK